jgi:ketosteroid isomerase-like protein
MTNINSGRRSFFLRSGTVLGTGLASAAGASTLALDPSLPLQDQMSKLHRQLAAMEDREVIRLLQLSYNALLENQAYETVVELFTEDAILKLNGEIFEGKSKAIKQLFTESYAEQQAQTMQTAFRQNQTQQQDLIEVSENQKSAKATFHLQVEISRPHTDGSVIEQMARLQGQASSSRWEEGRFEAVYRKEAGQWKISKLTYFS